MIFDGINSWIITDSIFANGKTYLYLVNMNDCNPIPCDCVDGPQGPQGLNGPKGNTGAPGSDGNSRRCWYTRRF